jgi:predicted RNase H-like HicB family nuclease
MSMSKEIRFLVEEHPDGFVAYPLGVEGVVIGQGDSAEEAISDARSALRSHLEAFGESVLISDEPVLDAFVREESIQIG